MELLSRRDKDGDVAGESVRAVCCATTDLRDGPRRVGASVQCRQDRCVMCTHCRGAIYACVAVFVCGGSDGQVVLGVQPSVHAAYQAQAAQLGISDQAMYDKLRQVELRVSAELVRDAARQASPVIGALQAELPPLVPGYRAKILDGNHLAASEHRLEALRHTWAAPLPGQILVVLDQQGMLAHEVILCEDGHAQERSLLGQVLPYVEPNDLWIADRNFCTV